MAHNVDRNTLCGVEKYVFTTGKGRTIFCTELHGHRTNHSAELYYPPSYSGKHSSTKKLPGGGYKHTWRNWRGYWHRLKTEGKE